FAAHDHLLDETQAAELESRLTHARHLLAGLDQSNDINLVNLASWVAQVDLARGTPSAQRSARLLEEEVLAARVRLQGEDHPDTLTSKNNLAGTLWTQGDLEGARRLQEEVLTAMVRLFGEDDPDTLNIKNNLAGTLWTGGEFEGARRLQEEVL